MTKQRRYRQKGRDLTAQIIARARAEPDMDGAYAEHVIWEAQQAELKAQRAQDEQELARLIRAQEEDMAA